MVIKHNHEYHFANAFSALNYIKYLQINITLIYLKFRNYNICNFTLQVVIERLGSSSVFERLGPSSKGDETPTSTNEFAVARPKGKPLPYRGVLKMTVGKNRTVTTAMPKNGNHNFIFFSLTMSQIL